MFKNSILTNNKKKVDVTKNGKGFLAARVQSPSVQLFRCAILVLFSNVLSQTLDYFWKHVHTLQIPDSHYKKEKKLKTGKNLLVLSKSLLVTVARTWDSLRFSMSRKVFNTSKFWLILSKNFLDLGMKFVYEKMATYKIFSPRKSIFSIIIFSTLKQSYNTLHTIFYKHQINSFQLLICLGNSKNELQKWTYE